MSDSTTDLLSSSAPTVNSVNAAINAANGKSTDADASQIQLTSDVNFFLKMLTTQLQNQDPTSPMDTNAFTSQIAQYSSVQQQVVTNANLEKLIASNQQSETTTAVGYIGKEIETKGSTGMVVGGQGAFSYILPSAASTVKISIADAAGNQVFSGTGNTAVGRNVVVWDGINSFTGAQSADGVYTITVTATDSAGKSIVPETRAVSIVSGVETDADGNTLLTVGQSTVNFADVLAVRDPSRLDLSGTGTDTGSTDTGTGSTDTSSNDTTTGGSS